MGRRARRKGGEAVNWSPEQVAIFNWFRIANEVGGSLPVKNLSIRARAGTGKTTTIKEAFNHAPESKILYAVFNKKNQKEAESKIKDSRVDVRTLHSLGFAFIKRVWSQAKPDDEVESDRVIDALKHFEVHPNDAQPETIGIILKLVGFAKNTTIKPAFGDMLRICEDQGIDFGQHESIFCNVALKVLEISMVKDSQNRISFNDMVWLPVAAGWVRQWFDLVCIDEAQDMNLPQLMMARQSCKQGGRIVVVGDDRQAIYGFRGAAQGGMEMMQITLRSKQLGLTTTYRCPKSVVRLAAEIVPDYKAAPEAPEGEVVDFVGDLAATVKVGDAILSRLNAPLMPTALNLIRKGVPARIEGRDIGRQLIGMVRSMKAKSVPHFIERVEGWASKQTDRLKKSKKNVDKKLEQISDISETLKAIALDAGSVVDIENKITSLFQDTDEKSKPAVILSTVHKAKGLEWPRVFMLRETFRKGKGQEEDNIWYVAVTRAQRSLFMVGGQSDAPDNKTPHIEAGKPAKKSKSLAEKPHEVASVATSNTEPQQPTPDDLVSIEMGMVVEMDEKEYVCTSATNDSVIIRRGKERVVLAGTQTKRFRIKRVLTEQQVEDFLERVVRTSAEQTNTGVEESDTDMKKTKVKTKFEQPSYAGRGKRIAKLVADKKTEAQILEIIAKEFPGSSPSVVKKTIAGKKGKPVAESKPAKKATAKPGAKAPAKKAVKKDASPATAAAPDADVPPPRPSSSEA